MPVSEAKLAQLRWRCRRGMLELDLLLNAYLDLEQHTLTGEHLLKMESLLDYPDQVLLDLLTGAIRSADDDINRVVARVRAVNDRQNREQAAGSFKPGH